MEIHSETKVKRQGDCVTQDDQLLTRNLTLAWYLLKWKHGLDYRYSYTIACVGQLHRLYHNREKTYGNDQRAIIHDVFSCLVKQCKSHNSDSGLDYIFSLVIAR